MLGHEVPFSYCRRPGSDLFCRSIIGCWSGAIDIQAYLDEFFTKAQITEALQPPKPKVTGLMELIRKAQENSSRES